MILIGFMYFRTRRPDGLLMTAFALIIGVGAFLQDAMRGVIVFCVVFLFAGLWALALLRFQRRQR